MIETTNRELPRWRGKALAAMFTTTALLIGATQALAPAPAGAFIDQGAVCTVDNSGWISCEPPPAGDESNNSAAPGDPDFAKSRKVGPSHGWSAEKGYDAPQQAAQPGIYFSTPEQREAFSRDIVIAAKCSHIRLEVGRVRRHGPHWYQRLWKLDKTKDEVLDDLLEEWEDLDCWHKQLR